MGGLNRLVGSNPTLSAGLPAANGRAAALFASARPNRLRRSMAQVQTVTGPIEAEELGTTLIHEHLRNADEAVHNQWPQAGAVKEEQPHEVAPEQVYDIAVREAKAAVDLGVKTIGEPTAMFLGRDVDFMQRVAEETGLQVSPAPGSTPTTTCRSSS